MSDVIAVLLPMLLSVANPEFAKYPAEPSLASPPAQPNMSEPKARRFRTVLRSAALEGANFNGHYVLTHWGCGTNCIEWAVVDLADGGIWFAPEPAGSCSAHSRLGEEAGPDWFELRLDSALFYLHGCEHDPDGKRAFDTRYVYVWRRGRPQLLRSEPLRK
jgi:hypothetical protein